MILGFEGSYQDGNPLPTAFRLNGNDCTHLLTAPAGVAEPDPAQAGAVDAPETAASQRRDASTEDVDNRERDNRGRGNGNGNGRGKGRAAARVGDSLDAFEVFGICLESRSVRGGED